MVIFLSFISSFLISILLTPIVITLAHKLDLVDDPSKRPHPAHVQKRIVARAGGASIFFAILFPTLLFIPLDKHIIGILLAIFLLLVVGLMDDYYKNFSPYPRLILQILAAGIAVASGIGISFITSPFGGILRLDELVFTIDFFGLHNIVIFADIFAFLWIVWMMNMTNWSKGVDGQMPGIITVASLTMGFLSYQLFSAGDPNQLPISALSFITAGSALGLLIFNWYPSKILPGFSGSTILGFMIATLSILSGAKLATALLVLLIPTIDFFYVFFKRIISKKSPFQGDKSHLHHRLLKIGFSHQQISLFYIISCAILGLLATNLSSQGKLFTLIGSSVILTGAILWLHLFSENLKKDDTEEN